MVWAVTKVELSTNGLPLAHMSDRNAYLFDTDLDDWVRIADASFLSSAFKSVLQPNLASGEVPWGLIPYEAQGFGHHNLQCSQRLLLYTACCSL
jgi:TUP1-like enhancer of split